MNMKEKHFIIRRALSALTAALIACSCTLPLQASASGSQLELGDKFDQYISNAVSDILEGVVSVPKEYRLNDADLIAPRPRRECYGETDSPEELAAILQKAEALLDGDTTLLSPDTELKEGTTVRYYLDDTILVLNWKQVIDGGVYTFSEAKVAHASQFRRFFSGGAYGSAALCTATEMATSVNAVAASSADYYAYVLTGSASTTASFTGWTRTRSWIPALSTRRAICCSSPGENWSPRKKWSNT